MVDQDGFRCGEVHATTIEHLAAVNGNIAHLQKMEPVLSAVAAECAWGDIPDCPITETLFDTWIGMPRGIFDPAEKSAPRGLGLWYRQPVS